MPFNRNSDIDIFNTVLLTSSLPDVVSFHQTVSVLYIEIEQRKVLATPVCWLISYLTAIIERLHDENSILKPWLKAATDVLAAWKEQKKGTWIALKDKILLTTDEVHAEVAQLAAEKKKQGKKQGKQGRKRKA